MTAQNGSDFLLKIDVTGSGEFQTVAGLRATKIAFNAQSINITNRESQGQWRELLRGGGIKSASLSGSGIFVDALSDERVRQAFFEGEHLQAQIIMPDFGQFEGAFQITALEYSGNFDGELQFEIALHSASLLNFIPLTIEA